MNPRSLIPFFRKNQALPCIAAAGALAMSAQAQFALTKPAPPKIEPGLELAVGWKWKVEPSDEKSWGLPVPEPELPPQIVATDAAGGIPTTAAGGPVAPVPPRPTEYEVQKGDALILIGKKFGMTVQQLKTFNGLEKDTIRIGQVLKIPTPEEIKAMAPPPPPPPSPEEKAKKEEEAKAAAAPKAEPVSIAPPNEDLLFQVFLDREQFSTGPIDGNAGPTFSAMLQLYRDHHEDAQNIDEMRRKAMSTVGDAMTKYTLREDDMRFIAPPVELRSTGKKKGRSSELPPPTYEELVTSPSLVYRSAWEFVAERFHCDETFLREMNMRIRTTPVVGTQFQVPNVIPFEIENAGKEPLQPTADPQQPVTAAVVAFTRLEIYRGGKVIAAMPLAMARPDLRGRGSWTILDAIPRPRLATLRELKEAPKVVPGIDPVGASAVPAVLAAPEYLPSGPNNPVGVVWVNLAKAKSTEPLPYGLHGTSIPSRMKSQEGIGGIRLANWDVERAVRLLPAGTALQWR